MYRDFVTLCYVSSRYMSMSVYKLNSPLTGHICPFQYCELRLFHLPIAIFPPTPLSLFPPESLS